MENQNKQLELQRPVSAKYQPQIGGGLWKLKKYVEHDKTMCWVIVAIAALATWPTGGCIGQIVVTLIGSLLPFAFDDFLTSNTYLSVMHSFGMVAGSLLSYAAGLLVPAGIVLWAIYEYRRHYRFTVSDLIWTDMPILFLHDEYGAIIEQANRERYRPNPIPVHLGESLADRLNHYSCYYKQYRQLARPIGEIKVPVVNGHNCWLEGVLLFVACCTSIACIGILLLIPMLIHTVLNRPRQVARKQAVVHYFEGRFDGQFPNVDS